MKTHDPVNHPAHYTSDPSNVECIEIVGTLPFALGNAIKYLWRSKKKGKGSEDLDKAAWYLNFYREQHGGLDSYLEDPALADLPWKRITQWALWQNPQDPRAGAIFHIVNGRYDLAAAVISELIEDLRKTNAADE